MVIEYAEHKLGFRPKRNWPCFWRTKNQGIDLANEFCEWARKNGHEDLIIDLTNEIGYH